MKKILVIGSKLLTEILNRTSWISNLEFIKPSDFLDEVEPSLNNWSPSLFEQVGSETHKALKQACRVADFCIFQNLDLLSASKFHDDSIHKECFTACLPSYSFYPYHIRFDEQNEILLDLYLNKKLGPKNILKHLTFECHDSSIHVIEKSFGQSRLAKMKNERIYAYLYENSVCDYDFIRSNFKNMLLYSNVDEPTDFYCHYILKKLSEISGFEEILSCDFKRLDDVPKDSILSVKNTAFFRKKFKLHYNEYNKPFIDAGIELSLDAIQQILKKIRYGKRKSRTT